MIWRGSTYALATRRVYCSASGIPKGIRLEGGGRGGVEPRGGRVGGANVAKETSDEEDPVEKMEGKGELKLTTKEIMELLRGSE